MSTLRSIAALFTLFASLSTAAVADFPVKRAGTAEENARDQRVHPGGSARIVGEEPVREHNHAAHHTRIRRKATAKVGDPQESSAKFEAISRARTDSRPGQVSRNGKVQAVSLLEVSSQGNATALAVGRAASQATFEHLRNPTIDPVRGTAKFGLTIKSGVKIRPGAVIVVRAGNSYVEAEYIGSNLHLWHVKAVLQRSTAARPDKPPKRIDEIVEGPLEIAVRASEASSVGDTWELKSGMKDVKLRVKTECAESKEKKAEVSASAVVKIDS